MIKRYVKIKGQSYPIKLSQEAVLQMAMDEGLSADQVPALTEVGSWPLKQMLLLILHSINVACEHDGIECTLTLSDIRYAISEDPEFQDDIRKLNEQSLPRPPADKKKAAPVARKTTAMT